MTTQFETASVAEWEVGRDADGWWVRSVLDLDGERLKDLPCFGFPEFIVVRPGDRVLVDQVGEDRMILGRLIELAGSAA